MFQKLYRHLEDISYDLQEDRKAAAGVQVEMIAQLETMNASLNRLDGHLAADADCRSKQAGRRLTRSR